VLTEKGETTTSFLLIQNAQPSDSGQYQCNPSNAKSKSVTVHVLNGKPKMFQHLLDVSSEPISTCKITKCHSIILYFPQFRCPLWSLSLFWVAEKRESTTDERFLWATYFPHFPYRFCLYIYIFGKRKIFPHFSPRSNERKIYANYLRGVASLR
jgi:hypothetical protein